MVAEAHTLHCARKEVWVTGDMQLEPGVSKPGLSGAVMISFLTCYTALRNGEKRMESYLPHASNRQAHAGYLGPQNRASSTASNTNYVWLFNKNSALYFKSNILLGFLKVKDILLSVRILKDLVLGISKIPILSGSKSAVQILTYTVGLNVLLPLSHIMHIFAM